MQFDFDAMSPAARFAFLTSAVVPRPIALIGQIVHAHVNDEIVLDANEPLLDTNAMHLIGGMHGAQWYARTSDLFSMDRPTWKDWMCEGKAKR